MLPGYPLNVETCEPLPRQVVACALYQTGCWLRENNYQFVTVTPSTHARMLRRAHMANSLPDIFGWNLPFTPDLLPPEILRALAQADTLDRAGNGLLRSKIRFSTLGDFLFLHSGYPTNSSDAVFFGPDTYRFIALIEHTLPLLNTREIHSIVDIGCGTGAGGIAAARLLDDKPRQLLLTDINPLALEYAAVNVALARTRNAALCCGDLYAPLAEAPQLILANPPYLMDAEERIYRHGGGELGCALSLRIVREGLPLLALGGTLILYTASPIISGRDIFREALNPLLDAQDLRCHYREIDPDVFGEELDNPDYHRVERIAVVSLVVHKASSGGYP